jgi:hypothetical protein
MLRAGLGKRAMIFHGQSGAPGCLRELDRLSRAPARRMRALLVLIGNVPVPEDATHPHAIFFTARDFGGLRSRATVSALLGDVRDCIPPRRPACPSHLAYISMIPARLRRSATLQSRGAP